MQSALSFVQKITCHAQQAHAPTVTLAWHERQKSRLAATTNQNTFIAIVLSRGETLRHGDLLQTEDGQNVIRILALEEPLLKISAANPLDSLMLMKLVYHLANRHVRMMITADSVFIEPDPVLKNMVIHLGGSVQPVKQIFEPEAGAYVHAGHDHSHASHDQAHAGHDQHEHGHGGKSGHDLDPVDFVHGAIGEELSKLAHARK
jgi:urease accessory protein